MDLATAPMFEVLPYEKNARKRVLKVGSTIGYVMEPSEVAAWKNNTTHNWKVKPSKATKILTEEDIANRPLCLCGRNQVALTQHGERVYFRQYCHTCADRKYKDKYSHRRIIQMSSRCSVCDFKPDDLCQLDVDHIDGNHYNDETANLQILCANCHRLKTYRNNENTNFKQRGIQGFVA